MEYVLPNILQRKLNIFQGRINLITLLMPDLEVTMGIIFFCLYGIKKCKKYFPGTTLSKRFFMLMMPNNIIYKVSCWEYPCGRIAIPANSQDQNVFLILLLEISL